MNKPMTPNPTPSTQQPPPGFRIIPPEWLEKNPLPGDGICRLKYHKCDPWENSGYRGRKIRQSDIEECIYATAEPLDCFKPTPDFRALCEELVGQLEEREWQPIETAPRDGTLIWVCNEAGPYLATYMPVYQSGYRPDCPWFNMMKNCNHLLKGGRYTKPTHWMPLPNPPTK